MRNRINVPGARELSGFCAEIAMMLSAGITIYEATETLAETYKDTAAGERLGKLYKNVLETGTLCAAMRADDSWPAYMVEMTGIGERIGRLEEIMLGMSAYYEREDRVSRAIRSAVAYPIALGVMLLLIIMVMILKVVPVFNRVLGSMGVAVNARGSVLTELGTVLGWSVMALVGVMLIAVLTVILLLRTSKREKVLKFLRSTFRPLRRVSGEMSASRTASLLAMMLAGGFPIEEAFELIPMVLSDPLALGKVERIRESLTQGNPLTDAISDSGLFDALHARMIAVGLHSGQGAEAMKRVANVYETEVEEDIAGLVGIIEPALIGLLSVIIGAILLSVMLPMAGIISSIL